LWAPGDRPECRPVAVGDERWHAANLLNPSELPLPAPSPFEFPPDRPVTIEVFGRVAVVVLRGDLERYEDDYLAETVDHAVRCGHHHLVLDLTATTLVDRDSYRAIVRGLSGLKRIANAAVVMAGASTPMQHMLRAVEADLLFTLYPARGAALAALRDPSRPPNDGWRTIPPPPLDTPIERQPDQVVPTPDWLEPAPSTEQVPAH
jgi:anti-anti-sigma regulatory factor